MLLARSSLPRATSNRQGTTSSIYLLHRIPCGFKFHVTVTQNRPAETKLSCFQKNVGAFALNLSPRVVESSNSGPQCFEIRDKLFPSLKSLFMGISDKIITSLSILL